MEENTTISPGSDAAEPVELAPMSEDEGDRAIANLLGGNLSKADPAQPREAPEEQPASDDDDEGLVLESDEEGAEPEGQQAPSAEVSDDTMVTLPDGQKISLGDLKRNNLFQRDYSHKTEELKRERERAQQEIQSWRESEEKRLTEQRRAVLEYASRNMPQPPDPEMMNDQSQKYDPIGYMQRQAAYEAQMQQINAVWEQEHAVQQQAQQRQAAEAEQNRVEQQRELFTRIPKLADESKRKAFLEDIADVLPRVYKVNARDVALIENAGYMHIVHDAIAYQKLKAKSATVSQELASKPKLEGKQRTAPQSHQARDEKGRFEALRQTGSIDAGDRAIEAFLRRRGS